MKKVVAFMGSPRKNGNTATLVKEVIRGAQDAGAETTIFNLYDMNVKPCQGCFVCRKTGHCVIEDDFQNMFKHIIDADAVVFGSPVYIWQVTAQMKMLWDRLCGFCSMKTSSLDMPLKAWSWYILKEIQTHRLFRHPFKPMKLCLRCLA